MSERRTENDDLSVMPMLDILSYIVHSNHHSFINMMILNSVGNIKMYYPSYPSLLKKLDSMSALIRDPQFAYSHKVVLFFFFLSIDRRMRHWILQSQQSQEYADLQASVLKKNIEMCPDYGVARFGVTNNPFLGQSVCFRPLLPASGVSIFLALSKESFFEDIIIHDQQTSAMMEAMFEKIRVLVLLS